MLPLIVDLDGTLVHTDMLHESVLKVVGNNPLSALCIPYWLLCGKALLKERLAHRAHVDPSTLPYNQDLLYWLNSQRTQERKLILCTASDLLIATAIANHLGVFDEVMASDGKTNLSGRLKANALEARFGVAGFDYVGNSRADLAVWKRARRAIVVNASADLTQKARQHCEVEHVFPAPRRTFKTLGRILRVHQWLKNILLFIPVIAAHQIMDMSTWTTLLIAFCAFSLCASSVYVTNDLLDLEHDRQHPRKCKRAFASGAVPAWVGIVLAPLLLLISLAVSFLVSSSFFICLMVYFFATCAYSWGLKRLVLIDCLTLAMLYTMRIIAGAVAAGLSLSFWLLAFSVFLFLSLAFVKRYAEFAGQTRNNKLHGRGYLTTDAPLVQSLGITAGYLSILVLALYLNSQEILVLYKTPELIWATVPILLYWISWMWLQAHRGKMHDDPLIYAVKDKASLLTGLLFSVVLISGTLGLPW